MEKLVKECWRCGGWMPSEQCDKCNGLVVWDWERWQEYKKELDSEITKLKKDGLEPPQEDTDK